jgi:hypothetical protein
MYACPRPCWGAEWEACCRSRLHPHLYWYIPPSPALSDTQSLISSRVPQLAALFSPPATVLTTTTLLARFATRVSSQADSAITRLENEESSFVLLQTCPLVGRLSPSVVLVLVAGEIPPTRAIPKRAIYTASPTPTLIYLHSPPWTHPPTTTQSTWISIVRRRR